DVKVLKLAELEIVGTNAADIVSLALNGANIDVTVNGVTTSYLLANYNRIEIKLLDGADTATVDPLILLPVEFEGGAGDDSLSGGGGNDKFEGGAGIDTYTGNAGADRFETDGTDIIT